MAQNEQNNVKMPQIGKSGIGKNLIFIGFIALLVLLGVYLFLGDRLGIDWGNGFSNGHTASRGPDEVLTIGYAFEPTSLEPTNFDPVTRSHLVDIYEGLVLTDRNLEVEPGLAVSWGLIDPVTWEFRLRPSVQFHNGKALTAQDVVYSLDRAVFYENSHLKDVLSTVKGIDLVASDRIRITTNAPDPLLLQKLAVVYIFPDGMANFDYPIGTGPYKFVSRGNGMIDLERNDDYWGRGPAFAKVKLIAEPDRRERLRMLEAGEIGLLANLPPSAGCSLIPGFNDAEGCEAIQSEEIEITSVPSLEVSFLVFNFDHELFGIRSVREALSHAFDPEVFVDIAFGFAKPADQFVSSGVFGFDPSIPLRDYDINEAKRVISDVVGRSFERTVVTFDYPATLQPIGEYVQLQLGQLDIDVELNPLSDAELQQKIMNRESDFYFLGWRSELGDASDFLAGVAHSQGIFNGANYMNTDLDDLIEKSRENLDEEDRLAQMQEAMKIIVNDDILGVPLFESETIFAFRKDIHFIPRVDGYVFASEVS